MIHKLSIWKENLERKALRVNIPETKILWTLHGTLSRKRVPGKWPCDICYKGVGSNSIHCSHCNKWIHKLCTGIPGKLKADLAYKCKRCSGDVLPGAAQPTNVFVGNERLEVVESFCYLGDVMGQAGGCYDAITARIRSAWKKFRELLPLLTNRGISLR